MFCKLKILLLLCPRKFKFKNVQKNRYFRYYRKSSLQYGQYGIKVLQPFRLTNRHIFRHKLFVKKASKRSEKTYRKMWFNAFPHTPLTKKPEGSRMGKGKGKLATWVAQVNAGVIIVEFKNVRSGRAKYYLKQLAFKLRVKSRILNINNKKIPLVSNKQTYISFDSFL
jgi:large subunit ribosomal protein L16